METNVAGADIAVRAVTPQVQHDVEQFLYAEAQMLDRRDFEGWLTLLARDLSYWMPVRTNRLGRERAKEFEERGGAALFDESWLQMRQRVTRVTSGTAWAEEPASRTRHLVTNVVVSLTDDPDVLEVESCFHVYRSRSEREVDQFVGSRIDTLRRVDDARQWEIARRTILLDMSTVTSKNLSIFF
jgi:biphenyl 2,3-dioxygenase subunit beta